MPRQARLDAPGILQHVIVKGRVKKPFCEADPRDWQNICAVYDNQE